MMDIISVVRMLPYKGFFRQHSIFLLHKENASRMAVLKAALSATNGPSIQQRQRRVRC